MLGYRRRPALGAANHVVFVAIKRSGTLAGVATTWCGTCLASLTCLGSSTSAGETNRSGERVVRQTSREAHGRRLEAAKKAQKNRRRRAQWCKQLASLTVKRFDEKSFESCPSP